MDNKYSLKLESFYGFIGMVGILGCIFMGLVFITIFGIGMMSVLSQVWNAIFN